MSRQKEEEREDWGRRPHLVKRVPENVIRLGLLSLFQGREKKVLKKGGKDALKQGEREGRRSI